jgi:hypothetical protein
VSEVFEFSKEYTRYVFTINYKTSAGKFRRIKGLQSYESYEEALKAAKEGTEQKYYIHRTFVR